MLNKPQSNWKFENSYEIKRVPSPVGRCYKYNNPTF